MTALIGDVERVRAAAGDCDAVVLTRPESLLHFTGFPLNAYTREGSPPWAWSPAALILSGSIESVVVADHQRGVAAERVPSDRLVVYDALDPRGFDAAVIEAVGSKARSVGVEERFLPASVLLRLPRADLVDIGDDVARICSVKEPWELDRVRAACAAAVVGQQSVAAAVRAGSSELELFHGAREAMETSVGGRVVVAGDLASGARAAREQGGEPSGRRVRAGETVVCDLAPAVGGFFGDSCSTALLGENPSASLAADAAVQALEAAAAALRPGQRAAEVDRVGRAELRARGFLCPHHLGHGLGLSQLEYPLITPGSKDRLEVGHIVALEPGVYQDGFAVRVEHVFAIGADGPQRLTSHQLVVAKEGHR